MSIITAQEKTYKKFQEEVQEIMSKLHDTDVVDQSSELDDWNEILDFQDHHLSSSQMINGNDESLENNIDLCLSSSDRIRLFTDSCILDFNPEFSTVKHLYNNNKVYYNITTIKNNKDSFIDYLKNKDWQDSFCHGGITFFCQNH